MLLVPVNSKPSTTAINSSPEQVDTFVYTMLEDTDPIAADTSWNPSTYSGTRARLYFRRNSHVIIKTDWVFRDSISTAAHSGVYFCSIVVPDNGAPLIVTQGPVYQNYGSFNYSIGFDNVLNLYYLQTTAHRWAGRTTFMATLNVTEGPLNY